MQIGGHRAVYNSAAIGMATALLAAMFIGLAGFYVVSSAVRRDVQTRCGFVIASTPAGDGEYIFGKFLGNVLFLATFTAGFMLVSMAMVLVRGEAPLQPLVFLAQYALIVPPAILFVSTIALVFESVPFLSGRFGDVAYFFLWCVLLALPAVLSIELHRPGLTYFDISGVGFVIEHIRALGTTSISIGASPFDAHLAPVVFNGFVSGAVLARRLFAALVPLPLLLVARAAFHRFDPARVKSGGRARRNPLARLDALLKPLVRGVAGAGPVTTDARMTLASPLVAVAAAGLAIASFAAKASVVMPIAFAVAAIAVAGVATRDAAAGTTALIRSAPYLKERYVWWKLASTMLVVALVVAIPALRVAAARPAALVRLAAGALFIAAAATALGVISANAKTFVVLYLSFWYAVVNDRGATPALDFAGFYGTATPGVTLAYLAIAAALLAAAQAAYSLQLRREA
jgi:hypothetical protein